MLALAWTESVHWGTNVNVTFPLIRTQSSWRLAPWEGSPVCQWLNVTWDRSVHSKSSAFLWSFRPIHSSSVAAEVKQKDIKSQSQEDSDKHLIYLSMPLADQIDWGDIIIIYSWKPNLDQGLIHNHALSTNIFTMKKMNIPKKARRIKKRQGTVTILPFQQMNHYINKNNCNSQWMNLTPAS